MRLPNIDFLKGALIMLVVLGHMLQQHQADSLVFYLIYVCHMPLFIGISGYLFPIKKIRGLSLRELLFKYGRRVVFPWVLAVLVYMFVVHHADITASTLLWYVFLAFTNSYFHLWFIAAYLSWVVMTWFFLHYRVRTFIIVFFSVVLALWSLFLFYGPLPSTNPVFFSFVWTLRPYFYIFFILGMLFQHIDVSRYYRYSVILSLVSFCGLLFLFFYPHHILQIALTFTGNASLLYFLLGFAKTSIFPRSRFFEWVGVNSLALYLWHVLPILLLTLMIPYEENLFMYYIALVLGQLLFFFFIRFLTRIRFVNTYFFGIVRSTHIT